MKLFDKRPLSLILCILLGAFVFFAFGDTSVRIAVISIAVILLFIPFIIKEATKKHKTMLVLSSALILLASTFAFIYFDSWYYADKRFDDTCQIEGCVESFDFNNGTKNLDLSVSSVNGKLFSSYKIKVYLESQDISNITTGTKLSFNADLESFDKNQDFDAASYYYARGYSAKAENVENLTVIGQGSPSLTNEITEYRRSLSRRLILYSDEKSGGLLAALLLGERDYLSGQISLDFSRIGISHILALSGMNIALLCYLFSWILSLLGLNKKWRKLAEIFFTLFYITITGFPLSVMRAGLMTILSALLFLLSSSKDSVTNLFISVTLIVLIMPYSIFDMSLWLSAFATLGIIIFAELTEKSRISENTRSEKATVDFLAPLLSSVFALGSTLAISLFSFNSISLFSIISTFIFSPIFNVFIYLGTFFLFTASFLPIGSIVIVFGNFITDFAHKFSSVKYSLLSTDFWLTKALIIAFTVFLFVFMTMETRKKKTAVFLITALLLSSIASAAIYTVNTSSDFSFIYDEQENRERILMKKDSYSALLEVSTPSKKGLLRIIILSQK